MKSLKHNSTLQKTIFSFLGQISFLLSNFILFMYLAKQYHQEQFGRWAIYITTISILDGMRQGFVQNGLARLIIKDNSDKEVRSTGLILNYSIVILTSALLILFAQFSAPVIAELYLHGFKVLIVLATIQYLNSVHQALNQFKKYLINNLIYFISFSASLTVQILIFGKPLLTDIINLMLIGVIPVVIYNISKGYFRLIKPKRGTLNALLQFGKYSSGTNLLSLLFQRVDLLMLNYFLDPSAVAIFHFANKIINYTELPLQALSQVIYPKITASYLGKMGTQLNRTYGNSILWLLAFIIPMSIIVIIFNKQIINLLGSETYIQSSVVIVLLSLASFFKPWGRVFGLTLDAVGKPKMNFYMLLFSLVVNVLMNWALIPHYGIIGAATATSSSIVITIIIGQFNIKRLLAIDPVKEVFESFKNLYQLNVIKKWN